MNLKPSWRMLATATFVAALVAGCNPVFVSTVLEDLPAELQPVFDNPHAFAQPEQKPAFDDRSKVSAAAVGMLEGCWGAYAQIPSSETPVLDNYEVYQFDTAAGRVTWTLLQVDAFGALAAASSFEGPFEIVAPGELRFTVAAGSATNPATGEFEPAPAMPDSFENLIALDGELLRIREQGQGEGEPRDLVFRPLDCP